MVDEAQNKQSMKEAIDTLNLIVSTNSTPKTVKKSITDLVTELVKEEDALAVRAANAISLLDDITQDANMPSYVRNSVMASSIKIRKHKRINSCLKYYN